jgi:hypothetical protein
MNVVAINTQLRALIAEQAATAGDGTILTEKRKKASDFIRAVAKRNGLKLSTDRDAIERIAGHIRWHGAGAAARAKAKGKAKGKKAK